MMNENSFKEALTNKSSLSCNFSTRELSVSLEFLWRSSALQSESLGPQSILIVRFDMCLEITTAAAAVKYWNT